MSQQVYVSCLSLVCPVGLTPESAAAALRAGISGFTDFPYADRTGERISGALVPTLPEDLRGRTRRTELLAHAFECAKTRLPQSLVSTDLPVLLCTREVDPSRSYSERLVSEIETRIGQRFRRDGSAQFPRGQVAVFEALVHAKQLFAACGVKACLIAAVDTLVEARTLCCLEDAKRLKTAEQSDGVIPGEAAGVAVVTHNAMTPSYVVVRGLGFGTESAAVVNDEPFFGNGMTSAIREALREAELEMYDIDFRVSDVAGESYAFEELLLAQMRLTRKPRESQELWHPCDCIGECGAAAGLIQLSWVEQAFARQYAPGPVALVHGSTPTGARAAAVLTE